MTFKGIGKLLCPWRADHRLLLRGKLVVLCFMESLGMRLANWHY